MTRPVHRFADTGTAYNETQWRDDIHDGDVLVVESERVVGFLQEAWPVAVTDEHGHLHAMVLPAFMDMFAERYAASIAHAQRLATELGFTVRSLT